MRSSTYQFINANQTQIQEIQTISDRGLVADPFVSIIPQENLYIEGPFNSFLSGSLINQPVEYSPIFANVSLSGMPHDASNSLFSGGSINQPVEYDPTFAHVGFLGMPRDALSYNQLFRK